MLDQQLAKQEQDIARERKNRQYRVIEEILERVGEGNVDAAIRAGKGTTDFVARTRANLVTRLFIAWTHAVALTCGTLFTLLTCCTHRT